MSTNSTTTKRSYAHLRDKGEGAFWIIPVNSTSAQTAKTIIKNLVGERNAYAFGWRSTGRKLLKAGDWVCFYMAKKGVVGQARVISPPTETVHDWTPYPERYPWVFTLENVQLYFDQPIRLDITTRKKLEAFKDRDNETNFGWFVRSAHRVSQHDYNVLTGKS
jgi:hypothetical protein